jgi:hypothetical protein
MYFTPTGSNVRTFTLSMLLPTDFHIRKLMLALGKVIVSINETRRARIAVENKFNWVTALQALCIS